MTAEPPHNPQTECRTCVSTATKSQPLSDVTSPQYHSPDAAIEHIGRVNEANILVGDIWVSALIDNGTSYHHY